MSKSTQIALSLALVAPLVASVTPQSIAFDRIGNQILGGSPFVIAADATSGLPVTFASTTPGICRAASNLVILLSAGTCSITASQGGNGSYAAATPVTRSFPVNLAKPSGTLTPAPGSPFAGGSESKSIAVGDFNGDGIQDLVVVNVGDSVAVLLGNGKGGFSLAPGSPITVETNAEFAAVGDFNGDGRQDLAVAHFGSGITVLLGDGSGGFAAAPGSPLASGPAYCVAVGDFNGDGIQDLAVPNLSGNNVSVLLGNAKGGFAAAPAAHSQSGHSRFLWRWAISMGTESRIWSPQISKATT